MSRDYSHIPPPPLDRFEKAEKYRYDTTIKDPHKRWQREETMVCWTSQPVGKGGMRDCYLVWEVEGPNRPTQMIGKVFQPDVKCTLEDYMNEAITQCVADTFAQAYNRQGVEHKVSFLACYVVIMAKRGPNGEKTVFTMEPMLRGIYEKHNNNVGQTFTDNPTAEAFSHFTYVYSGHRLLVCDLQGVGGMYTDPQIHSVGGGDEFGLGNLGADGVRKWIQTHRCGPLCTAMELQPFAHAASPAKRGAAPRAPPPRTGGTIPPPSIPPPAMPPRRQPQQPTIDHNQMVQEMQHTFRRASLHHQILPQGGRMVVAQRTQSELDIDRAIKESIALEQRRSQLEQQHEQEILQRVLSLSLQEN
eukprot:TRINITY_DN29615_c0_g1_i1.p1 TRINITY_DN29615_c0_g1~~TRINITY_DN29615_c0_g1_i1.p1  ORF type:complete len:359 (+),score=60.77 TRINITY_DN29615_c0_g1_i1:117-1193(+)